ncbi:MAG: hypothetical protein O3C27_02495 [Actinomycetota bacterium]|nr:hypothetical protein [Actinomycetota bacterium]
MIALLNTLILAAEGEPHRDDNGQVVTHSWILPEAAELIYGTISSIIIFALLYKFAGPAIKKGFNDRTARIQQELDATSQAQADATAEAATIMQAKGDIDAERQRMLDAADAQGEMLLAEGRVRLDQEIAELEARAASEVESGASRAGDELRAEITRTAAMATERILAGGIDPDAQQALIEGFISKVGAS